MAGSYRALPKGLEDEVIQLAAACEVLGRVDPVTGEAGSCAESNGSGAHDAHSGTAPVIIATTSITRLTSQAQPMRCRMWSPMLTPASPTSYYSFLNFLFVTKRLYRFINASFSRVTRMEFNQYLRWVCGLLPSLEFGRKVESVSYDGTSLVVQLDNERIRTRNVILGSGLVTKIPDCARLGHAVTRKPAQRVERALSVA